MEYVEYAGEGGREGYGERGARYGEREPEAKGVVGRERES